MITSVSALRIEETPRGPAVTAGMTNIYSAGNGTGFDSGIRCRRISVFHRAVDLEYGHPVLNAIYAITFPVLAAIPDALLTTPQIVQIKMTNIASGATSASLPFTVNPFPAVRPLPNGTVGVAYGPQNLITGGTAPITVTATNPPLPVQTPVGVPGPPYISGMPGTAGNVHLRPCSSTDAWGQGFTRQLR